MVDFHFRIVEAVVDLAFLVIKEHKLKLPDDEKKAFDVLEGAGIISKELNEKLKDAKGMRNILAHEYGKIDDILVFEAVTEQLDNDVRNFLKQIKNTSRTTN